MNILNDQYDLVEMGRLCIEDLKNSVYYNTKKLEKLYDEISIN